ncbi:myosin light chain kinase, smooth muscle [Synchiropus picturatus]
MNDDSGKQRYVSTFRMHIKSPCAASPARIRPAAAATGSSAQRSPETGVCKTQEHLDPPVFTKPLDDCGVDEGSDIVLSGALSGSQPINVKWLHNGKVSYFGKASFDGSRVSYVVTECLPEDAGAYTCLAENSAGKTSCSSAVFVRDFETICAVKQTVLKSPPAPAPKLNMDMKKRSPLQSPKYEQQETDGPICRSPADKPGPVSSPKEVVPKKRADPTKGSGLEFLNPPQHLDVRVGEAARLTCSFTCSPPVVSCWIRNKDQVVDGTELWVENTESSSTLVIAEAKPQHTGRYTVVVKDRRNSAQHSLTLSVIERPQPPASCPVVSLVSVHSLVLSWCGPCYDGGSAVLGYVVEVKRKGASDDWTELTSKCRSTSYKVSSGLQPQEEYSFRVKAFNAVGTSEPGPESRAVKMEQKEKSAKEEASPQEFAIVSVDHDHKVAEHYLIGEKLGVGKFGQVFKLVHKETGRVCAGKFYKGRRQKEREAARKEIELMNHLHHPKLVQCLAAYDHKPEMVMVMEFIAGGELFERIVDDNFEHTESASVHYIQQILEGMDYMHQRSIVHLDLKPENIVCVDSTGTSIKIIDFGLACKIEKNTSLKVMQGTPEFVAPEVINFEPVSFSTDMWSIGVICYILLSGESPFQGSTDTETLALVTAAQWEFDEESFEEITEEAKDFISSLLEKDPRHRMLCKQAMEHPWMAAFDSEHVSTKSLSKEKMKRFLAKQKWKKAGKAMLALKRMAMLSKGDSASSPVTPGEGNPLSPEAVHALKSLEEKIQGPPKFTKTLAEQTVDRGACARLSCHLTGYPDPEVVWLRGDEPVEESPTVQVEYEEDGSCTLVLSKVGPEDANVYTCRATNGHGESCCSAKLIVQG